MHIVTISFDDGLKRSFLRIAEIYERFGLSACLNVLATAPGAGADASGAQAPREEGGDFGLWNELQARGHEVMPHGYRHANKAKMPFEEAKGLIARCLEVFSAKLDGFRPERAVFNFPFNASTPELEAWLPTVVRAFRTSGEGINPLPSAGTKRLTCTGFGPGSCDEHLDDQVERLLALSEGWLVYNGHGLDGEGWGPMRSGHLERLIERLVGTKGVRVLPAARALASV